MDSSAQRGRPVPPLGAGVAEPDQLLISAETCAKVKKGPEAHPIPGLSLKGVEGEVTVWEVGGAQ